MSTNEELIIKRLRAIFRYFQIFMKKRRQVCSTLAQDRGLKLVVLVELGQYTDTLCSAYLGFIKPGTSCQYMKTERLKKNKKILASFEKVINLAAVDVGFYVAVSPWWELSCSFLRVSSLQFTSIDQ